MDDVLTLELHEARVAKAGCLHPAGYVCDDDEDGEQVMLGWCKLCRAEAIEDGGFDDLE